MLGVLIQVLFSVLKEDISLALGSPPRVTRVLGHTIRTPGLQGLAELEEVLFFWAS